MLFSIIKRNINYAEDVNILSVSLALGDDPRPFTIVEADCAFDAECVAAICDTAKGQRSSWYTIGNFMPGQVGGILLDNANGLVQEIKIVPSYQKCYSKYKKLVGVLTVGPNEVVSYTNLLRKSVKRSTKQYYLEPWINNLEHLQCFNTDLSMYKVGAFNTSEEYNRLIETMAGE